MMTAIRMWIGEHVRIETKDTYSNGILRFVDDDSIGLTTIVYHNDTSGGVLKRQFLKGEDQEKVNIILPLKNVRNVEHITATPL